MKWQTTLQETLTNTRNWFYPYSEVMITPFDCEFRHGKLRGKGTAMVVALDRHKITGEPITLCINMQENDNTILKDGYTNIVLSRKSAQQLADDINFLLG